MPPHLAFPLLLQGTVNFRDAESPYQLKDFPSSHWFCMVQYYAFEIDSFSQFPSMTRIQSKGIKPVPWWL